jgi:hypothetical protein
MADNVTANAGSGGAVFATDDISSVHYPYAKLSWGADGTANIVDAASGKAIPVQGEAAHDAATTGNPLLVGGRASAAAPTDVSADGDATRVWTLRNGAVATVVTAAGALVGGDATNGLDVDVTRVSGTVTVGGVTAHDSPTSGSPVLAGGEARTSDGTAVSNGDAVRFQADTLGKQVVLQGAVNNLHVSGTTNYTSTSSAAVIAAGGAGVRFAVTSITVTNGSTSVNTKVNILDGTTVMFKASALANGGGWSANAGGRPLFITAANSTIAASCTIASADVDVSIGGYGYST